MAKFYGAVGYATTVKTAPGVSEEVLEEHDHYGDIERITSRLTPTSTLNDNIVVSNTISIMGDDQAYQNFHAMRYAVWMGAKWKITSVDVRRPRLILTLGEVYNGLES